MLRKEQSLISLIELSIYCGRPNEEWSKFFLDDFSNSLFQLVIYKVKSKSLTGSWDAILERETCAGVS